MWIVCTRSSCLVGRAWHVISVIISVFECAPTLFVQKCAFKPTTNVIFFYSIRNRTSHFKFNMRHFLSRATPHPLQLQCYALLSLGEGQSRPLNMTLVTRDVHSVYPTHWLLLDLSMDVRTVLRPAASRANELCGLG